MLLSPPPDADLCCWVARGCFDLGSVPPPPAPLLLVLLAPPRLVVVVAVAWGKVTRVTRDAARDSSISGRSARMWACLYGNDKYIEWASWYQVGN